MSTILLSVAVALIGVYLLVSVARFGVPKSVSYTNYLWGKDTFVFSAVIVAVALLVTIAWLNAALMYEWLVWLSGVGLCYVGAASRYEENLTCSVHYAGALLWAGSAIAWLVLCGMYVPIAIGGGVAVVGLALNRLKNVVWWLELSVITMLIVGLYKYFWLCD